MNNELTPEEIRYAECKNKFKNALSFKLYELFFSDRFEDDDFTTDDMEFIFKRTSEKVMVKWYVETLKDEVKYYKKYS